MKKIILFTLFSAISFLSLAQSTEILPGNVLPSMTTTQRNALASPKEGMLVFDTTAKKYYFRRGSTWEELGSGNASAWGLSGNAISPGDFIGTTNNQDLVFKVNGEVSGRIATAFKGNIAFGYQALYSNTDGFGNIANGYGALYSNTIGANNIANGYGALYKNTLGDGNIANGYQAIYSNTIGANNIANGFRALYSNTSGGGNIANGTGALYKNTFGDYNIASGYQALFNNTEGTDNIAIGRNTQIHNQTGLGNIALGREALENNESGFDNISLGTWSLRNAKGTNNIGIGLNAGNAITTGDNNIVIGANAQVPTPTAHNQIQLGNGSITYAGVKVGWTITSDRRYKKNIQTTSLGLNFVNRLRPVSYIRINDERERTEYGFIAQEVEEVMKNAGIPTEGILSVDDQGMYSVRYNDFIAISVKAIQELSDKNSKLENQIASQNARLGILEAALKTLMANGTVVGED